MSINKKIFLVILNIFLAFGFFIDNRNALYTDISSDSANIIPVCKKKDNPNLYSKDLYLSDLKDVEYYTPFYVESLRFFAKFTDGNYVQAQNILGSIVHFIHGILWFLLFYTIKKEYWIALLMMLLTKGVIWPPGGELIGITDLWTIMPRTVYTALLPLPYLLFVHLKRYQLPIAAIVLGFILNFHPLSGIGGIVGYLALYSAHSYFREGLKLVNLIKSLTVILFFCLIGMFPYLYTYFNSVNAEAVSNRALYELAFNKRIPRVFSDPIVFIKRWNRSIFYFYLICFGLYYFYDSSKKKKNFKILLICAISIFLIANLSVYVEQLVNQVFNLSIRMSFQLIRFQKFILVVFQIATFLLMVEMFTRYRIKNLYKMLLFVSFYALLMFSDLHPINKVPLLGDDICTSTIPHALKLRDKKISQKDRDFNEMLTFIKNNIPSDAVFYGSYYIRHASEKSVVLDEKGASMVIEGNPEKLCQWYLDINELKLLSGFDKINFLKSKKVTHILTQENEWDHLKPLKIIGETKLYQIQ